MSRGCRGAGRRGVAQPFYKRALFHEWKCFTIAIAAHFSPRPAIILVLVDSHAAFATESRDGAPCKTRDETVGTRFFGECVGSCDELVGGCLEFVGLKIDSSKIRVTCIGEFVIVLFSTIFLCFQRC